MAVWLLRHTMNDAPEREASDRYVEEQYQMLDTEICALQNIQADKQPTQALVVTSVVIVMCRTHIHPKCLAMGSVSGGDFLWLISTTY